MRLTRGNESIRCETVCSKIVYSVRIGPPQPKLLSFQQLLRTLQPSEFVCRSGDSRKLRIKTLPRPHDGFGMIDSFRFARPPTNGEDSSTLRYKGGAISQNTVSRDIQNVNDKGPKRRQCCSWTQSRAEPSCQARDRESRRFRDTMGNCVWVGGPAVTTTGIGQTQRRWLREPMNQKAYCMNRGLCRQKHQKIAKTLVRLLAYLLAASCAQGQTGKLSAEKQVKIESTISNFMTASKAPSISAAVVQDGEFVWSAGFGMADLENSVPATSQTVYRIGSISKSLTATAAMELWERGKLDMDSPVQKYCPAFPQKPWPITTRELLGLPPFDRMPKRCQSIGRAWNGTAKGVCDSHGLRSGSLAIDLRALH